MREDHGSRTEHDAARWEAMRAADDYYDERPTLADATADLGCRAECGVCGRFVWSSIHTCSGVPVTDAARDRAGGR